MDTIGRNNSKVIENVVVFYDLSPLFIQFTGQIIVQGDNRKKIVVCGGMGSRLRVIMLVPNMTFDPANEVTTVPSGT